MNITFLIGNGFDINLGLATRYSDFLNYYIQNKKDDDKIISYFKKIISSNEMFWSDVEVALGQITKTFKTDMMNAEDFSECHENFCENLANYLLTEEKRINFETNKEKIYNGFVKALGKITASFPEAEKDDLSRAINKFPYGFKYNFINFNYTKTLNMCINSIDISKKLLGVRGGYKNEFGKIVNVHGTLNKGMIFGVHDKSQIADKTLFNDYGEEYINQIIKSSIDRDNRNNTYIKADSILNQSNLIYIYGMSTGVTDKRWWERICLLMNENPDLHLIIHKFDAPKRRLIMRKYISFERKVRDKFISYCNLSGAEKEKIARRIHIDASNIFEDLHNIADSLEKADNKEIIKI